MVDKNFFQQNMSPYKLFWLYLEYNLTVSHQPFSDHYTTLATQNGHYLAIHTIMKNIYITYHCSSYSRYEYITIWYHIHNLRAQSHANHNEEAGKEVIIMNCIWLICIFSIPLKPYFKGFCRSLYQLYQGG